MKDKNSLLIILGFVLVFIFALTVISEFNFFSLATDSGFDTSYDSGGSSWDSGDSSWDNDSNWDSSYDSSSASGSGGGSGSANLIVVMVLVVGLVILIPFIVVLIPFIFIICIASLIGYAVNGVFGAIIAVLISMSLMYFRSKSRSKKNNIKFVDLVELTPENINIKNDCYNIFCEVQKAWMDFDYNKLRTLVTDELYNTYYNQLQTLSLKGQKNIMSDFEFVDSALVSKRDINNITTVLIRLRVRFYDYIVDSNYKIMRGNSSRKVDMTYMLEFVINKNELNYCPNCNAPLDSGATICNYCHSNINAITGKMKLSVKKVLSQR